MSYGSTSNIESSSWREGSSSLGLFSELLRLPSPPFAKKGGDGGRGRGVRTPRRQNIFSRSRVGSPSKMPQVRIIAKNFMDMVAALPAMKLERLYDSSLICEAVLRWNPPPCRPYVRSCLLPLLWFRRQDEKKWGCRWRLIASEDDRTVSYRYNCLSSGLKHGNLSAKGEAWKMFSNI